MVIQGVSYPSDFEAKKLMIEVGRRMEEKGYVLAGDGSLSVRVGPNAVWITEEGADKGALKQENFIRVDMNGKQSPGTSKKRLAEDISVHLAIYNQNPALRGILHGYPAGAVAYALQGREISPADYTPSVRALGRISLVHTESEAAMVCKNDSGVMVSGQGCLMWGESLLEAFHKIQALEYCIKIGQMLESESVLRQAPAEVSSYGRERLEDMEGLTPVIRPGERTGFQLPVSRADQAVEAPAARKPVPQPSQAVPQEVSQREKIMAEVVRRSLASLQ